MPTPPSAYKSSLISKAIGGRSLPGEADDLQLAEIRKATNALDTLQTHLGISIPTQVVAGSLKNALIKWRFSINW